MNMIRIWARKEFEQKLTKITEKKIIAPAAYSPLATCPEPVERASRASVQILFFGFG